MGEKTIFVDEFQDAASKDGSSLTTLKNLLFYIFFPNVSIDILYNFCFSSFG
jgi:hypothetical protein